jgi:hypothetical protein
MKPKIGVVPISQLVLEEKNANKVLSVGAHCLECLCSSANYEEPLELRVRRVGSPTTYCVLTPRSCNGFNPRLGLEIPSPLNMEWFL